MKKAKLIKRSAAEASASDCHTAAPTPNTAAPVRASFRAATAMVNEHRSSAKPNPREQFAALFNPAQAS